MKHLKVPSREEFILVVEKHENIFGGHDQTYLKAINKVESRGLPSFEESELCSVLWSYLVEWGNMGRVLGHKGCSRVAVKLKEIDSEFAEFKNLTLTTIDIEDKRASIESLYNELVNTSWKSEKGKLKRVAPTTTAKVLHLIVPNLFMIWDREIRTTYEFKEQGHDYVDFLFNMQNWLKELQPLIEKRRKKLGKSCTKVIDEYNWMKCWANKKGL